MCIEFVIQVLKQKNVYVSFTVGMVTSREFANLGLLPGTLEMLYFRQLGHPKIANVSQGVHLAMSRENQ